jgi:cobalt-zinc-cadmium efflux system protein
VDRTRPDDKLYGGGGHRAFVTGSLALLSDAAHMLTDVAALAISLVAIHIAKRSADRKRTFGYARFEILAATFNAVLLFLVAIYIVYEAYLRLKARQKFSRRACWLLR